MSGPGFFLTRMGREFFEGTVPRALTALGRLADNVDALAGHVATLAGNVAALTQMLERWLAARGPGHQGSLTGPN
jgi:hypothetical protein